MAVSEDKNSRFYPALLGAFVIDSANLVGDENICRYLCSQDIVVVTFNYRWVVRALARSLKLTSFFRLGIFGFLTLANKSLPGNYGLFDMALALEVCKLANNKHKLYIYYRVFISGRTKILARLAATPHELRSPARAPDQVQPTC